MVGDVSKAAVLEKIESERAQWNSLLTEIGEDRMEQPALSGNESVKDIVAHLSAWRNWSLDWIEAASREEPTPSPPWPASMEDAGDVDAINAWIHQANRDRTLDDVMSEARGTFDRLQTAVRALPDDDLADPQRFPWMNGKAFGEIILDGSYFGHLHEEHEPELREWLAASA